MVYERFRRGGLVVTRTTSLGSIGGCGNATSGVYVDLTSVLSRDRSCNMGLPRR